MAGGTKSTAAPDLQRASRSFRARWSEASDNARDMVCDVHSQISGLIDIPDFAHEDHTPASSAGTKVPAEGQVEQTPAKHAAPGKDAAHTAPLTRDKFAFCLGILNIVVTAWWLGYSPATFYHWYCLKAVVFYSCRFFIYRAKKLHYYMLEFCYLGNVLMAAEIFLLPNSPLFHKIVFAQVAGTLTWAIAFTRNSLVLHSLDKITSLFMHLGPALVVWVRRWFPNREYAAAERALWEEASLTELCVLPMIPYVIWAVLYYLKVFVISSQKVKNQGYATLYTYTLRNRKSAPARLVMSAPEKLQPLVYMSMHVLLTWAAVCTSVIWWHSFWAHSIFIAAMFSVSVWNGACYYFDIFAVRYRESLIKETGADLSHHKDS